VEGAAHTGLIKQDGKFYDVFNLPANFTLRKNLWITNAKRHLTLPDNFSIDGDAYLTNCAALTSLPANLSVGGSMILAGCHALAALPDNLSVGGALNLRDCHALTALPDNLKVGENIITDFCVFKTVERARQAFAAWFPVARPSSAPRP